MAKAPATTLSESERRTLDRLVRSLRESFGVDLHAVWLFGSRGRGEPPRGGSDVDLIVVTTGGIRGDRGRVIDLLYDAAEAEGASPVFFSVHVCDPEWIAGRRAIADFFIQEVDRDKIVLAGSP